MSKVEVTSEVNSWHTRWQQQLQIVADSVAHWFSFFFCCIIGRFVGGAVSADSLALVTSPWRDPWGLQASGDIVPLAYPGSFLGPAPCGICLEHLSWICRSLWRCLSYLNWLLPAIWAPHPASRVTQLFTLILRVRPATSSLFWPHVSAILFFGSIPKDLDHRWEWERRSTNKLRASPLGSVSSSTQQIGTATASWKTPSWLAYHSRASSIPHLWTRPQDTLTPQYSSGQEPWRNWRYVFSKAWFSFSIYVFFLNK